MHGRIWDDLSVDLYLTLDEYRHPFPKGRAMLCELNMPDGTYTGRKAYLELVDSEGMQDDVAGNMREGNYHIRLAGGIQYPEKENGIFGMIDGVAVTVYIYSRTPVPSKRI